MHTVLEFSFVIKEYIVEKYNTILNGKQTTQSTMSRP